MQLAQNYDSIKHGLLLVVVLIGLIRSIPGKIDFLVCELLFFSQRSAVPTPSSGRCSAVVLELLVTDSLQTLEKNPAVAVDTHRRPSAPAVHY